MKLQVATRIDIFAPKGTVILANNEWLTLGRKTRTGNLAFITCHNTDISNVDFFDEENWVVLAKNEIQDALKILK